MSLSSSISGVVENAHTSSRDTMDSVQLLRVGKYGEECDASTTEALSGDNGNTLSGRFLDQGDSTSYSDQACSSADPSATLKTLHNDERDGFPNGERGRKKEVGCEHSGNTRGLGLVLPPRPPPRPEGEQSRRDSQLPQVRAPSLSPALLPLYRSSVRRLALVCRPT